EAGIDCDRLQVAEAPVDDHRRRPELGQRHQAGLYGSGIAVDPKQPAARCDPLQDLAGVARLPEGAVDRDRAHSGLKQLYYLLWKCRVVRAQPAVGALSANSVKRPCASALYLSHRSAGQISTLEPL